MIKVYINGNETSINSIKKWEEKRMDVSKKYLKRKLGKEPLANTPEELALYKASIPADKMHSIMLKDLNFTAFFTNLAVKLSGKRRKVSVTEIDIDFCNSKQLLAMYDDMMLNNTAANILCSLRANPDHYLLRGIDSQTQEVIEITGGLPVPSKFFIKYDDFNGLTSKQDPSYEIQAAGACYLENGLCIGGVRHQMKDTEKGCHIKLSVEFPFLLPKMNIAAHQKHLACEFYNWFSEFERRVKKHASDQ